MKLNDFIKKVNYLYESDMTEEAERTIEANSNPIKIMFPLLDDKMRPRPELVYHNQCKYGIDGKCYDCPRYLGYKPNEEGVIFAYMQFDGYCFNGDLE